MNYTENEEKAIISEYKLRSRDKLSKKREGNILAKLAFLVLFVSTLSYCVNSYAAPQMDSTAYSHVYYRAGIANIHRAYTMSQDIEIESMRREIGTVIQEYIAKFSSHSKNNAALVREIKWKIICCINRHDYIPDNLEQVHTYLDGAIKCFQIYDRR